jgi:hypothetical protein
MAGDGVEFLRAQPGQGEADPIGRVAPENHPGRQGGNHEERDDLVTVVRKEEIMKNVMIWLLLFAIAAMGVAWYFTRSEQQTKNELKNVTELAGEQSGGDSTALRAVLVSTPPEKVKEELLKRVSALRDSANVLRDDAEFIHNGEATPDEERQVDHLRRHAAELESLATRLSGQVPTDAARLELYRSAIMTYGAGSYVSRQLRAEIGLPLAH